MQPPRGSSLEFQSSGVTLQTSPGFGLLINPLVYNDWAYQNARPLPLCVLMLMRISKNTHVKNIAWAFVVISITLFLAAAYAEEKDKKKGR